MKITRYDLSLIFSNANTNYQQDDKQELNNQEFVAQCYFKAIASYLHLKEDLEFPIRKNMESVDE